MIGEIEAFLDESVYIDGPMLARALTGVQQHVLHDGVGALAVLNDLVEITLQRVREFNNLRTFVIVQGRSLNGVSQLLDKFNRNSRKIVDEIQRVLDLMRDTGG